MRNLNFQIEYFVRVSTASLQKISNSEVLIGERFFVFVMFLKVHVAG